MRDVRRTDRPVRSEPPHLPETESVPPRRTHAITRGGACAAALRRIAEHPCGRTNREIPTTSDRQAAASGFSPVEPEQPAPEGAHPLPAGRAPKNLAARLFPLPTEHKPAAGVPEATAPPPKPCEGQSPPPADKPQIRSEPGPEAPPRSKKTSIRMSAPSAGLRPRTVPGPARLPSVLSRRMPRRYAASASSPHRERAQSSGSATSRPSSREAHIRKRFREREAGGGIKRGCPKRIRQPLSESGFRSFLRGPTSFLQPQIVTRERERTADQCAQEIEYLGRHPAP